MNFLNTVLARFKEPSTWAGTGVGAVLIHAALPGAMGNATLALVAAAAGFLAVVLPESKKA